jgi:hypothetical protein
MKTTSTSAADFSIGQRVFTLTLMVWGRVGLLIVPPRSSPAS